VLLLALELLTASFLPEVEDPWLDQVGLGLPFTLAGGGAIVAGVLFSGSPPARRDRVIRWGGALGLLGGILLYLISLIIQ
jgi:predicted tellurium resistance membrane protein TerC